jgi:hypothetical protein
MSSNRRTWISQASLNRPRGKLQASTLLAKPARLSCVAFSHVLQQYCSRLVCPVHFLRVAALRLLSPVPLKRRGPFGKAVNPLADVSPRLISKFLPRCKQGGPTFRAAVVSTLFPCRLLETKVSNLELELMAARAAAAVHSSGNGSTDASKMKVFMVVGVNTAFSSRSRRDSYRETWFPTGEPGRRTI